MKIEAIIALAAKLFVLITIVSIFLFMLPKQKKSLAAGVGATILGLIALYTAWSLLTYLFKSR